MKVALIVDNQAIARWQHDALEACGDRVEVVAVLSCTNTRNARRPVAHFLYYLINVLMMRGPWRRRASLPACAADAPVIMFESAYDGIWQRIPSAVADEARALGAQAAIKFGMNLVADPDGLGFEHGVLSYHHGDPERYRGRPAGFYELYHRAPYQGVIVQRISNTLDGGAVLARVRAKVFLHSYRATLANAYRASVPLLGAALDNAAAGRSITLGALGRSYRLPSNTRAAAFLCVLAWRNLRRYAYGALFEKRWQVGYAGLTPADTTQAGEPIVLSPSDIHALDRRYVFYADPFPFGDGKVVAEALNRRTGRGELVVLDRAGSAPRRLPLGTEHYSYPSDVTVDGKRYLLPEVAYWSDPFLIELDADGEVAARIPLRGMEGRPIVDPTYVRHDGVHYVFGGHHGNELDSLYIYYSTESVAGPYRPHPRNPVVVDPGTARMAGGFIRQGVGLYRLGQDNTYAYGDGITVLEIVHLSPTGYRETPVRRFYADGVRGPHTLNFSGESAVFDFYTEGFAPGAGFRRLSARLGL